MVNILSSQNNNPNSVSHVCSAQLKFSNIDKNTFIRSITIEIDSSDKDSCRDNKAGTLILLKVAETEYPKNHYRAASQNSQSTDILQKEFRRSSKQYRYIINAVDSRDKKDSVLYIQQYIWQPKKIQSIYKKLDIFSKIELQISQKLFETESDISIFSYNIEKQIICKKKKAQLDSSSFSNTRNISVKTNILYNIDSYYNLAQIDILSATCNQNLVQIIQSKFTTQTVSEDSYIYLSIFEKFIQIAEYNKERSLKADRLN